MSSLPELPAEYTTFLESHSGTQPYVYDNVDGWWLATSDKLLESVNIDGKKHPYVHQLRGYVATLRDVFQSEATTDADGKDYAFERLAAGLAIGDNNGDTLFLDPSNKFAVWCFYHDGGYVEKLAASFAKWLSKAKLDDAY
ncbi:MAG: SMI1/KNR4 family protein [Phycisphaerae bacterium]|jgi:hypothetical protein|nr:SMI1/KNR4 family protein [Phycisphaerae bacterium]